MNEDRGAVAIWHDITPEGRANFYAWHGSEHMPERLGIPGFVRGRRYVAIEADLEFFNLYETELPSVVAGPDYKARLDNPTPWTMESVKAFRSVARSLCRVAAAGGEAEGGLIATLRYEIDDAREAEHVAAVRETLLPALLARGGIAAARLLVADRTASGYVNAEQRARGAPNAVPPATLLVEGWGDEADFMAAIHEMLGEEALAGLGAAPPYALGFYRHQITVRPPGRR